MKNLVLIAILFLAFNIQSVYGLRLSEPVHSDEQSETFGEIVQEMPDSVDLERVVKEPASYLDKVIAVEAEVKQVCQKKGCFFIAQQGAAIIRVSFKDYSFFVPTDVQGREVLLVGVLQTQKLSDAQAKHLSKDAGEANLFDSGRTLQIVASSVRISKVKTSVSW